MKGHLRAIGTTRLIFCLVAVVGFIAFNADGAIAALPFDPSATVASRYIGWVGAAQNAARTIYMGLIVFDLIVLAITSLLFRENLGEFFASLSLKVLMGGVFFWLISNGPSLASAVIQYFTQISKTSFGGTGPDTVITGFLGAGTMFFAAAGAATGSGVTAAEFGGVSFFGSGDVGAALAAIFAPESVVLVSEGLGMMLFMGAFAILLQFTIVTIESYLVMSVGTLMIGFAGSRFTFSFSQGYFSYMINVGIKLLVTYIIFGVVSVSIIPIVLGAAGTFLVSAAIPFAGYGASVVAMGVAAIAAVYVILVTGLIWTIPAFTASLLTGQSQSSGAAILQQAVSSFAGAAQMFGQFGAANRAFAQSNRGSGESGKDGHAGAKLPAASGNMSQHSQKDFAPAAFHSGSGNGSSSGGAGALGGIGHQAMNGNGPTLYDNALTGPVNPSTGMPYTNDQGGGNSPESPEDKRAQEREGGRLSLAYGLSGAAQAAPRDIGQPTAVQVRLSNPDKL